MSAILIDPGPVRLASCGSGLQSVWKEDSQTERTGCARSQSHEIKRHLLLARKAMKNVDSILKSRNITLPTKVYLVKAMVFTVVTVEM